MKNLLQLYISYMKLVGIGMVLAAIGFTFYAEYKARDEVFFQLTFGGLAALWSFYVGMIILALKLPGVSRDISEPPAQIPEPPAYRAAPASPHEQVAARVAKPVPSNRSRAIVAAFVLVCNAVALITYAQSKGWPIGIALWSFSAFSAMLTMILWAVTLRKRPPSRHAGHSLSD